MARLLDSWCCGLSLIVNNNVVEYSAIFTIKEQVSLWMQFGICNLIFTAVGSCGCDDVEIFARIENIMCE